MWKIEKCPQCNAAFEINGLTSPTCTKCNYDMARHVLPFNGADHCCALHAEERAIIHCFSDLDGAEIYTTTYPCLECTKKIVDRRLGSVWYVEPYPSGDYEFSKDMFKRNGIKVLPFEGVKGAAFEKFFSGWQDTA